MLGGDRENGLSEENRGPRLAWLVSVGREKKRSFLYSSSQHQPLRSPEAYLLESGQIMSFDDLKLELWGI